MTRAAEAGVWRRQAEILLIVALMAAPCFTGAAGTMRAVFPAAAVAVAGAFLLKGDLRRYVTFCVWLFVLTPGIRRVADLHAGFAEPALILTAPYLCLMLSCGTVPYALTHSRHPVAPGLILLVASTGFGLALTAVNGQFGAGGYDALRWIAPPCFGAMLAINRHRSAELVPEFQATIIAVMVLSGAYGVWQFTTVPAWDAYWMNSVKMNSIGLPYPYEIRIFSTMNSPGSFAFTLLFGIAVTLAASGWTRWIAIALASAALALTIVRSAWIGAALSLLLLLAIGPASVRRSIVALAVGAVCLTPLAIANPRIADVVVARFDTFSGLSSDTSVTDRMTLYQTLLGELDDNILGRGLGMGQAFTPASGEGRDLIVDGGPVEIVLAVGLIGAVVYYAGVAAIVVRLFSSRTADPASRSFLAAAKAGAAAGLVLQMSGPTTVGEVGFFFWTLVGLGIAVGLSGELEAKAWRPREVARLSA